MESHELASAKWSQPNGLELTDYALRSISNEAKLKAFDELYQRGVLSLSVKTLENGSNVDIIATVTENFLNDKILS